MTLVILLIVLQNSRFPDFFYIAHDILVATLANRLDSNFVCFGNCATFLFYLATNEGNFPSLRAAVAARLAIVHSSVSSTSGDRNQKVPRYHRHQDACHPRATDRTRVEVVPS